MELNGPLLREKIMNPLKGIVMNQANVDLNKFKAMMNGKYEEIQSVFMEVVDKVASDLENQSEIGEVTTEAIANALYSQLNGLTLNFTYGTVEVHGGTLVSKNFFEQTLKPAVLKNLKKGITDSSYMGHTDPNINYLLKKDANFTRRLLILASNLGIDVEAFFPDAKNQAPRFELSETSDGIQLYCDIYSPFVKEMGGNTETVARNYFENLKEPKKSEMIKMLSDRAVTYLDQFFH